METLKAHRERVGKLTQGMNDLTRQHRELLEQRTHEYRLDIERDPANEARLQEMRREIGEKQAQLAELHQEVFFSPDASTEES